MCWGCFADEWAMAQPQRIVSTAPSITEMLFALDAGDQVVGVTSYCDFPPAARDKPTIGDFAVPNLEAVLEQRPDLVVLLEGRQDLVNKFQPFSLETLILRHETLAQIMESISLLGREIGRPDEARKLVERIEQEIDQVRRRVSKLPVKKVLFLVGRNTGSLTDMYAVGDKSYIGQLIHLAGGQNIFGRLQAVYPKVSIEQVMARDPEIIVDLSHGEEVSQDKLKQVRNLWSTFPMLTAVEDNQVHVLSTDVFLVPGPRVAEAVQLLARVIHREDFN